MTLQEIAQSINIECDNTKEILGLSTLLDSEQTEITFLENKKYLNDLKKTRAAAVLINKEFANEVPEGTIALICDEPYLNLAKLSKLFAPEIIELEGEKPVIGGFTKVMPNVYIGKGSRIGSDCTIMAGAYIGDNVKIGNNTVIHPNVVVYRDCNIGSDCIIHAGTVIGSDGFGFANTKDGKYIKIYQNGNVEIGDDVEIGSNCAIDRAVFKSTQIANGVRIDNLVHIGHNCKLGTGCILTGQVGLSGSTVLNHYVIMGGQSGTAGHLEIAPFTTIAARGGVTKSITEQKKSWAGFPLIEHRKWLKLQSKIAKLLK
ncbi:UDP-3-O-(3-hydroxymyristoyl)glucosamine N-acyltransferase [Poseidonibacter lekithochrous]|uniref:UDP-3-O-(3-hydroxymyristoyl)glucosamine N-acyltransferase n=1 Tax=Poseidonibacter TaxID=2321187 RepID=UPI001C095F89|nr:MULTISPECIES: UDP-3-O-(3-hydroxymyristoyl)glucosamine N-acyltransferase [Poseidonibacter]MBU3014806.1 UDP-3-O-(3-hydroxymyristoyl)glucosamine N-acyltransferase [Poseidonibacter lekithochrous]MDO6828104.1 UDP-3-O-(3-hydroxymyristoyl)glucosamine N-acyltransferase [Poseidonibacter sp. 1_MG-2023]